MDVKPIAVPTPNLKGGGKFLWQVAIFFAVVLLIIWAVGQFTTKTIVLTNADGSKEIGGEIVTGFKNPLAKKAA